MPQDIYLKKTYNNYRWLLHICFWLFIGSLYYLNYKRIVGPYVFLFVFKDLFIITTLFYSFGYYFLPRYFLNGKLALIIPWVCLGYAWWAWITFSFGLYLRDKVVPQTDEFRNLLNYLNFIVRGGYKEMFLGKLPLLILDFTYLIMMPLAVKLTKELVAKNNEKVKLERDYLQMEINFLKAQINPHFLSNSLNTINALVAQEHPYTQEAISKLGNILHLTLYLSPNEKIPLTKEIEIIKEYLEFQKYRFKERVKIKMDIAKIDQDLLILPHLLFTFIENAYKHGVEKLRDNAHLSISVFFEQKNELHFSVENNFNEMGYPKTGAGIGIENVRKRLEHFYEGLYKLDIDSRDEIYKVNLVIKLI